MDVLNEDSLRTVKILFQKQQADYSRCPDITNSAAIDPVFKVTTIKNEKGKTDYPYYWTSTSHVNQRGSAGVYILLSVEH